MMASRPKSSGAWWKQLSDFLHDRTDNRLRRLQIRAVAGHVSVQALAPCDRVREAAEAAVREVVPAHMLAILIKVDGQKASSGVIIQSSVSQVSQSSMMPSDRVKSPAPELFEGNTMFRRVQQLISGN